MRSTSRKCDGFGLIEVMISMAIIGIISMSVYNGYILAIKQTKEGQVKQTAALEGKKVIEEIKSADTIQLPNAANGTINVNNVISLNRQGTSDVYLRFLDQNFDNTDEASVKYVERITIDPTGTMSDNNNNGGISFNNTNTTLNPNDINYKIYMSKEKQQDNSIKDFIHDNVNESNKQELIDQDVITLSMYLENHYINNVTIDSSHRDITIKDIDGLTLLSRTLPIGNNGKVNINMNFKGYKQIENSTIKPVVINLYNETTDIPNIYLEKANTVSAHVNIFRGKMNLYDNRAEDANQARIGTLYNIKVEVMDYKKYQDDQRNGIDENGNLFTADYKLNIK